MRNLQLLFTLVFISIFGLSACSKPQMISIRGNLPNENQLSKLQKGLQNRNDVLEILGSPSSRSMFDEKQETWYYISSKQERFAFFAPEETDRKIIAITFGENGIISRIKTLGLEDANEVNVTEKETPTAGHDSSIVRQLLGNIGRFKGSSSKSPIDTDL
ncbi:MAG: outer membrane protein assembly factor BamE [Alphaproteobacteria bacterium]|nr:outer membrane protein assembly factor BamE [Alphaproteobacteria bacterium]